MAKVSEDLRDLPLAGQSAYTLAKGMIVPEHRAVIPVELLMVIERGNSEPIYNVQPVRIVSNFTGACNYASRRYFKVLQSNINRRG